MRAGWLALFPVLLLITGNTIGAEPPPRPFPLGFLFEAHDRWLPIDGPVDALFAAARVIEHHEVGSMYNTPVSAYGDVSRPLPQAREYWLVYRDASATPPWEATAPGILAEAVRDDLAKQERLKRPTTGLLLDIRATNERLPSYAQFLRKLRSHLPKGVTLSITADLQWFRSGTAIQDLLREVDEFVPLFIEAGDRGEGYSAAPVDAAKWTPIFSRFRRPYRVGISTMGRQRFAPQATGESVGMRVAATPPFDLVAGHPAYSVTASRTAAAETKLLYRAQKAHMLNYARVQRGDTYEYTVPTMESARLAIEQAKRMGPLCIGVLFSTWPSATESLPLSPREIQQAASLAALGPPALSLVDGTCAAVACTIVYAEPLARARPNTVQYRILSSEPLEYLVLHKSPSGVPAPARITGPREITLELPPYAAINRLCVGRVVTRKPTQLSIDWLQ